MVAAAASTIAGRAMNEVGASEAIPVSPLPTVQPSASSAGRNALWVFGDAL